MDKEILRLDGKQKETTEEISPVETPTTPITPVTPITPGSNTDMAVTVSADTVVTVSSSFETSAEDSVVNTSELSYLTDTVLTEDEMENFEKQMKSEHKKRVNNLSKMD